MVAAVGNEVLHSINLYYNALANFGYKKQDDVNKLLIYIFIDDLLTGPMRQYINELDLRVISKALNCLYGSSCLIPYPPKANEDELFGHFDFDIKPRITEGSNVRFTEDGDMRFKASGYVN